MGSRASAGSSNGRKLRQQLLLLCIAFARINGLVPFAEHAALRPWLDSQSFGCIAGGGALRPRLASLDDGDPIVLGVMEGGDVDGVAKLLAASFAPTVVVEYSGGEEPTWEDAALGAVASAARSYDVAEYAFGLRARCGARLRRPEVAGASTGDGDAVVLLAARRSGAECVGAVELRLRDADGAHPTPLPAFDRLAGLLKPGRPAAPPRPYVANVCVADRCRRRGLARALVSAAEHLAGPAAWGYDSVFLHVHRDNVPALELYDTAGYDRLEALDVAPLRYLYKPLRSDAPDVAEVVAMARGAS